MHTQSLKLVVVFCGFGIGLTSISGHPTLAGAEEKKAGSGAAQVTSAKPGTDPAALKAARERATNYLRTTQSDDGSWTASNSPGISGLVTTALLRSGVAPTDPMIRKALAHLETFIQKDGGIYDNDTTHKNYETSIALLAFQAANGNGKYDRQIADARDFLKKLQWDGGEGLKKGDTMFGGAGYGRSQRPDLSNTAFLLDALKAAGVKEDDEAMQNAVVFVSRCQNLESEHNATPFAAKVNDGGFYYTPAAGGSSQAGPTDNGGLRSYGSMTYAGLKSMIYAGVSKDDPRVKAAFAFIQKHYSVEENPGMGQQGLFYYYQTFGKALDAMQIATIDDAAGNRHDWRKELGNHILGLQKENGSWVNPEKRWMEGDPHLATGYALLALVYCEAPGEKASR